MEKSYTWGHSINHNFCNLQLKSLDANQPRTGNQTPHKTVATSVYQFRHWDCTANGWELRGLNLQFNILAVFSKWSTIHITGFLGEVFESAAADKWPEVTRRNTRRITWSWWTFERSHPQNHVRKMATGFEQGRASMAIALPRRNTEQLCFIFSPITLVFSLQFRSVGYGKPSLSCKLFIYITLHYIKWQPHSW